MDRCIITGGNGFIGKHLVKKLLSEGLSSIAIIANTPNIHYNQFIDEKIKENYPLTFHTADIRDKKSVSDIFINEKPDVCIHLAAKISVADSMKNSDETMNINVNGTLNVLEACNNSNVNNFIFASSAAVYGDVNILPISEDAILRPLSPYGTSKMVAEQHITSYKNLNKIKRAISLRIFNVYGQGQGDEQDVISKFTSKLLSGMAPVVYGAGIQTRDFISVGDVVDAFILSIRLMEEDANSRLGHFASPLVFNIGTGIQTSINEIATKMINIFGFDLRPDYQNGNDKIGILRSYADINKAKKILRFDPKKEIDDGLRELIEPMLVRKK